MTGGGAATDEGGVEGVEHQIGHLLEEAGLTLAVAESVTGGGVGARLVTVPGASAWFRGGLITYAVEAKVRLAGLDPADLLGAGPVRTRTAGALAIAARDRLGADVGVGVVGVAGPGGFEGEVAGTVRAAVATPDGRVEGREGMFAGEGRVGVQHLAVTMALELLRDVLRRA